MDLGNLGAAAGGAAEGVSQYQDLQARRFALEQARRQATQQQAAQNAQQAATIAFRRTMASVYGAPPPAGPQPPMPGQASVPMQQPPTMGAPAPLPPYRPLQRDGQPGAVAPAAAPSFELPPKPPKPQLDMQTVMANAPQDSEAFDAYMAKMGPYLSSQSKAEMEQQKLELQYERTRNQLLESEQRIANATTPAERKAALEANIALKNRMADIAQENADTRKEAAGAKTAKATEKKQTSEDARKQALQLVSELEVMVAQNPGIVGLRGSLSRGLEAVGGMAGGTDSRAHDFQQKVRMLQNIVKKYEPYGPEGRVLKGELADRDQIVEGLGSFTSAPNALSSFSTLKRFLSRDITPPASAAGDDPTAGWSADKKKRYEEWKAKQRG